MKLMIKHLVPYLPYKIQLINGLGDVTTLNPLIRGFKYLQKSYDEGYNLRPLLRPLSDLTKEIEHNGEKFVPADELNKMVTHYIEYVPLSGTWMIGTNRDGSISLNGAYRCREKLFEWHFDVFGLIDEGLAIDINTLELKAVEENE